MPRPNSQKIYLETDTRYYILASCENSRLGEGLDCLCVKNKTLHVTSFVVVDVASPNIKLMYISYQVFLMIRVFEWAHIGYKTNVTSPETKRTPPPGGEGCAINSCFQRGRMAAYVFSWVP